MRKLPLPLTRRVELLSCGGGRQSAGIAALIVQGQLPRPDHVCMVALEWEVRAVFKYVNTYIRPAMQSLGIPFSWISRKKYATKDMFGGEDGKSVLLPVYTNQSGVASKLPEYCSGEWKRDVVMRWAASQPGWKDRGVVGWMGISFDEQQRIRTARRQWFDVRYPLVFDRPTRVGGCLAAVERMGWPKPPRSRCGHCPNQTDAEWLELPPAEFEAACVTDEYVRSIDPHAFLHKQMIPLRQVQLVAKEDEPFMGGCQSGMCY